MIRRALVLVALFCLSASSASAATRSWTGAVNNLMSVGGNWSEGTPPADGDDLLFPNVFMAPNPVNDIAGLDAGSITGDPSRHYQLTGNALTVAGGITGNFNLDLPVTLTASQTFSGVGINDNVNLNGHTLTFGSVQVGSGGSITGAGNVTILAGGSLEVQGGGGSVTFTGTLTNHGALSVTGTVNGSTLVNDGAVAGIGIIPVTTMTGGSINPGFGSGSDRIGVLTMGTLTFNGGTYAVHTTGVHSDRLNVIGNVVLTNANLTVALSGGVPSPGSSLIIVANDNADPVAGTFNGLPEGAPIAVSGVTFTITYIGGDGNDIALFVQSAPKSWTGAVNNLMSVGGNWNDGVPPVDGDDVTFPDVFMAPNPVNDIAGLDLGSITGDPNRHYQLTGNALTVAGGITGNFNLDLPVTLTASQTFSGVGISDNVNLNGHTLTFGSAAVGSGGSITGAGNVTILAGGLLDVQGGGGSVTFTGTLTNHGSLSVTGTVNGSTLVNDGGIGGIGIIPVTTMTGGSINPGSSAPNEIGVLTMGTLTFNGGTYNAHVTGVHSDRLNVIGNVVLTNATLAVTVFGAVPSPGSSLIIVANDNADPVTGTFNGLPEGAVFAAGGVTFLITYLGGDGNDVALVVQSAPKSWTGAVNNLMSVGGNWNDGVPPVDGDDLIFPDVLFAPSPVNDLVGLDLGSITGTSRHYSITGNPLTVAEGVTGNFNLDLPITLTASQTFSGVGISDNVNLNGHTLTLGSTTVGSGGSITGAGNVIIPAGRSVEVGLGASVTFTGTLTNHGVLSVVGTVNGSTLVNDGAVAGIGIIPVTTMTGGTIGPGFGDGADRIGVLTMGTLTFNAGTYNAHVTGVHSDRLNVIGSVILTNANLQVAHAGAVPAPGSALILVANDNVDPVTGTFNGLPEGAIITVGTITFQITYTGGDGNDVALLVVTETETALTASDLDPEAGEPVTLTATVTSDGGTPTGTVVFREGATILATAPLNAQGVATATVVLPGGPHAIVAEYQGDGAFASSVSPPITINSQHAEAIPTLGELALMLFAMLIGLAGVLAMRHA